MKLEPAKPKKESLRSWMVKLEAYREWYKSLTYLDSIMFKIKYA